MVRQFLATLKEFFGPDPRILAASQRDEILGNDTPISALHGTQSVSQLSHGAATESRVSLPVFNSGVRQGSQVVRAWQRIQLFCEEQYEELRDTLNWPAKAETLNALQHGIGRALPQAVCEWLLCCDGQEIESYASCSDGLFFGLPFLGSDAILREWRFWRLVDKDERTVNNPDLNKRMASCPPGWVRKRYSCPDWIPLISDGLGNYIGVDLSPDPNGEGKPGQVILFGRDFDTKMVLYGCDGPDGWAKFLVIFADELERGTSFVLGEVHDEGSGEDGIGYESYFASSGDRAGEGSVQFRLKGLYAGWPVMESWFDRSARAWERIGYPISRSASVHHAITEDAGDISTSSTHDPMDPLHSKSPTRKRLPRASPATSMPRESSWPEIKKQNSLSPTPVRVRRSVVPKPAPLTDLPTIDDVRAAEASEMSQRAHGLSRFGSFRKSSRRTSAYMNMPAPATTVDMEEPMEMSLRPVASSLDVSMAEAPSATIDMSGDISTQLNQAPNMQRSTAQLLNTS